MKTEFKLDWNFSDETALDKTIRIVKEWIKINIELGTKLSLRVKDMMLEIAPDIYEAFSRGDKCRVGRAVSIMYNEGYFSELCRGKKNGATNTYYLR